MSLLARCILVITILTAACADSAAQPGTTTAPSSTSAPATSDPARDGASTTDQPITTAPDATEPTADQPTTTAPNTTVLEPDRPSDPACRRLSAASSLEPWAVVNDNVMGGRSLGGLGFSEHESGPGEVLVFEGVINTDGGGFSSIRLPLSPGDLSETDRIVIRARPDGRRYMLSLDDDLASRDPRVSHRAPIRFVSADTWQTVTVRLEDLEPARFGRPVEADPFRNDLASQLTLMISDGLDGPFALTVDWIDACS